jgi:hypothetical protein
MKASVVTTADKLSHNRQYNRQLNERLALVRIFRTAALHLLYLLLNVRICGDGRTTEQDM